MTKRITTQPNTRVLQKEIELASEDAIRDEPMLFGASVMYARQAGGPLTNKVLDMILPDVKEEIFMQGLKGYHPVIDTKSVMLMPGWYACIPGWHCDGVIRSDKFAQPDVSRINEDIKHYICSYASVDTAPTEYIDDPVELNIDENQVWGSVNKQIEEALEITENSYVKQCRTGQVLKFNRPTLHRGTMCDARCWRFFFRLSFYHMPAMNEVRNQVQVYADPSVGW